MPWQASSSHGLVPWQPRRIGAFEQKEEPAEQEDWCLLNVTEVGTFVKFSAPAWSMDMFRENVTVLDDENFSSGFMDYVMEKETMASRVMNYILDKNALTMALAVVGCLLAVMVAHCAWEKRSKTIRHLSLGGMRRPRRWKSTLASKWKVKMQLRGILFLSLMGAGNAMGQQQQQAFAEQVLNQVAQLVRASVRLQWQHLEP